MFTDRLLCRSLWQWAGHWSDHEPLLRGRSLTPSPLFQRVEANVLCLRSSSGAAILRSATQWPQGTASSAISSLAVLSQLHLPWPDALCQMALNTNAKMCNAKSTNGHVSNVPMQSQPMAYVQCPSSTQNKAMVTLTSANAMQSQPMGTVQCANVKSTNTVVPMPPYHRINEDPNNRLHFACKVSKNMPNTLMKCQCP